MNFLLDSHVLLWALTEPTKLTDSARIAIADRRNAVFFSVASVWEMELKAAKGKLLLPANWVECATNPTGFTELPIQSAEAVSSVRLPWHHTDPFDRLLIAQANRHNLTMVSRDRFFSLYGVPLLEA